METENKAAETENVTLASAPPVSKREQVLALVNEGKHTKAEIAALLEMSPASVSSQFTYLRWMGNFIVIDSATKVVSSTDKESYDKIVAAKNAAKSASRGASKQTPQERSNALARTITKQKKQLANAEAKVAQIQADLIATPNDEELQELLVETQANVTIIKSKLKRNEKAATDLPAPVVEEPATAEVESEGTLEPAHDENPEEVDDVEDENQDNEDLDIE